MGGILSVFSPPSPPPMPGPPPKTQAQIEAEKRQALADKKAKEEKSARGRGLRGTRSLLSAGFGGFEDVGTTTANKLA